MHLLKSPRCPPLSKGGVGGLNFLHSTRVESAVNGFYEVSEKPLNPLSETSDYTDFKKITKISHRQSHLTE